MTPPRIGRTLAESTPANTPPNRAPEGAPNVVVIVLDDLGFAQLGCFGSDIAHAEHRRASPPAACATTASTSPRCARRRARACSPAATTTRSAWASSPTCRSASPGYNGAHPDVGGDAAARAARRGLQHVRRRQVAPRAAVGASARRARSTAGRSGSASSATTASSAATPTSGRPTSSRDNHYVEPPRAPDDGYHLTEDLADQAIRTSSDQQQATPDKPVLPLLRDRRDARAAPRRAEWIEPLPRPLRRRLGARGATRVFARQLATRRRARRHRRSPSARAWVADVGRAPADEQRLLRAP